MNKLTNEDMSLYWSLHERMWQEGYLDKPVFKYCDFCNKVVPFPAKGIENEHFRWIKGTKSHRCRFKSRKRTNESHYRIRNTIDGFLQRRYNVIHRRCTKPKDTRYEICKNRLNITEEEFLTWGQESLPIFIKENKIKVLYDGKGNITVDRIDGTGKYEIENLQWILRDEHQEKSFREGAWSNNGKWAGRKKAPN